MHKNEKVVCIIPARKNSKGLPGKNIKDFCGRPLIAYTIMQAKRSQYIDRVIVSTDSRRISGISKRYGADVPFLRPSHLATDRASAIDVLLHALDWLERKEKSIFGIIVLLHANTPLRSVEDIDNCIRVLFNKGADNVFSVTPANRNPYFNMVERDKSRRIRLVKRGHFVRRQDAPEVFDMNSSIYVWRKDAFKRKKSVFLKRTVVYVMPKERSVDIDDGMDFRVAEQLFKLNKNQTKL